MILLACSKSKHQSLTVAPAKVLYTGLLFRLGLKYAELYNRSVYILSAKYGFIASDTIIETYDTKRTKPYPGPWPDTEAHYIGGQQYFKLAPSHILPLVQASSQTEWMTGVENLIAAKLGLDASFGRRAMITGGKIDLIFQMLKAGPVTKEELFQALCAKFGYKESMRITINAQVQQCRIGVERGVTVNTDGERYWVT
jgi:hypothetical protein